MVLEQIVNLSRTTESVDQLMSLASNSQVVTTLPHESEASQSQIIDPSSFQQTVEFKVLDESSNRDRASIPPENTVSNQATKQDVRCGCCILAILG